jgi:SPP1 family predicted phage head-tail adaptor
MITAGSLDWTILIQSLTVGADGMGAITETWSTVTDAPKWAQYIPLRGTERIEAGKMTSKAVSKIRIRRYASLTPAHRVVHSGATYQITGIEDNPRDGDMVLWLEEIL